MDRIKLIVSDIDGTLVDKSETIPQELIRAVEACRKAGIIFALATGRTTELVKPFMEKLKIDAPCIAGNGAYIIQGSKCLTDHGFSIEPVRDIIKRADALGLTVTISTTEHERALRETGYVREHKRFGNRFTELLPFESIDWEHGRFQKVMIMDEERTGVIQEFTERLEPMRELYWITTFSSKAVELGPKNCNKATGVRELAGILNIPLRQVMACGDYQNDIEMLELAGYGVAVANALPEVKEKAVYVARNSYALGVAEAIKALCFSEYGGSHAGTP